MNRRSFLKMSSLAGGGFLVALSFPRTKAEAAEISEVSSDSPWFYAEFQNNAEVFIKLGKQEMGQGAQTGLVMLFAEEAGLNWEQLKFGQIEYRKETQKLYDSAFGGTTGGSSSVSMLWEEMRLAGARVRENMIRAAAEQWGVPTSDCEAREGKVFESSTGRSVPFSSLALKACRFPFSENPKLKEPSEFQIIGKPVANKHEAAIVDAKAIYGSDVSLPGMVYAVIERCPVLGGRIVSVDESETLKVAGVLSVHILEGEEMGDQLLRGYPAGVAVVAESTWAAIQGRKRLQVEWEEGQNGKESYDTLRRRFHRRDFLKSEVKNDFGDTDAAFALASIKIEGNYETFYQAHAAMEPLNSTAVLRDGEVEIWSTTQNAKGSVEAVAEQLKIPIEKVVLHSLLAGGSFGRRAWSDYILESALLARELKQAVKVIWSREDDIRLDHFHPYKISKWEACVDDEGFISGFRGDYAVQGDPAYWWILHWAYLPYGIDNVRVMANLIPETIRTGAWRSVVEHLQAFPEESFIDEVAHRVGEDPYYFRLKHARRAVERFEGDEYWRQMTTRACDVFESVPRFVDWDAPLAGGVGRGIAISKFLSTVVLQIAEVEVSENGYKVLKVDAIVAPGLVVNPQLAESQIEGAIVFALSALNHGRLTFENGRVLEDNFDSYPVLRMSEMPAISVHFLEDDGPMGGMGEPGVPALAPAVCNAIFAASGRRIRTLPVQWD